MKKQKRQVRFYVADNDVVEFDKMCEMLPFLNESDVASMLLNASLDACRAHGYPLPMPLKLNVAMLANPGPARYLNESAKI